MNQSIVTKQVAREIRLLRYIPEYQLYEIAIQWDNTSYPIVKYLPEVHLIPYAVKTSLKPQTVIKVTDSSEDDEKEGNTHLNETVLEELHPSSTKLEIGQSRSEPAPQQVKSVLDYDRFVLYQDLQSHLINRNLDVVRSDPPKIKLGKRKIK